MAQLQKEGGLKQRGGSHNLSETQIRNDSSFAHTHKVPSRNNAAAKTSSKVIDDESSEYDSEDADQVDSFSQYGNRKNLAVLNKEG